MATQGGEGGRVDKPRGNYSSKLVIVIFILSFSVIIITFASLETQSLCFCGYTQVEALTITKVTFGSMPGQVTFWLQNTGPVNITVVKVSVRSPYPASVSANIVVLPVSNLTATITFTSTTFQTGTQYDFGLLSTHGNTFLASATA